MKFQKFEGLVYDEVTEVLGLLVSINHLTGKATIAVEDGEMITDLENLVMLEKIVDINGEDIVNRDVFSGATTLNEDKLWEIELLGNGNVVLHLLDEKLNRVETGEQFEPSKLELLVPEMLTLEGNIYEFNVVEEKTVDFNIKIVKQVTNEGIDYMYACNNKETEEVDLIKVVFVGSTLLEEENYQRVTVTHEEYLEYIEAELLTEVTPQELQNYVTGLMYGYKAEQANAGEKVCGLNCGCEVYCEEENEEDDFFEELYEEEYEEDCDCDFCRTDFVDNDLCDDCGEYHEDCDC